MRILYIGDVMARAGITAVEEVLPALKIERQLDVVIAQAENVTDGKGISKTDFEFLRSLGIDFFTGGNWSIHNQSIFDDLENPQAPIIRPANYPAGTPGLGYKYLPTPTGSIMVVSLMGKIVGKDANAPMDNPLRVIDAILAQKDAAVVATVVNLHGDYSSEKRVIGYYLDGRASLVVGDHWHVPTADAMVLPKGTAHISDVGMCGTLHSSLGVELDTIIPRWRDGLTNRNLIATDRPLQFNAVIADIDEATGRAISIESIHRILA